MLLTLQYLRGLASLLVVFYHARGQINDAYSQSNLGDMLFENGYIGVDLFFMISGFVIMLSTEKDKSPLSFIIKRIFRIYPVYLICLLLYISILNKPFDINFVKSLLFINLNLSSDAPWFGYAMIFTAWTLMFEIIFYIIFCVSLMVSWKYRGYLCSTIIIFFVAGINLYFNGNVNYSGYSSIAIDGYSDQNYFIKLARVLSSPMFLEFVVGMMIYKLYRYSSINKSIACVSAVIAIVLFSYFYVTGFNGGHGPLKCGLYAALLLLTLVTYEKKCGISYFRILNFFGNISYSLYLTHALVLSALSVGFVFSSMYVSEHGLSSFYFIILASILMSTIFYYTIELHCVKLGRVILRISLRKVSGKHSSII